MTNKKIVMKAFKIFESADFDKCNKLLEEIARNFDIHDDEFSSINLDAKIYQPHREDAEKLISEGKEKLVGDEQFVKSGAYLEHVLRFNISFKSANPYCIIKADFDDESDTKFYFGGHVRIDRNGNIAGMVCNGDKNTKRIRNEITKICEKWLLSEFGICKEFAQ